MLESKYALLLQTDRRLEAKLRRKIVGWPRMESVSS